MKSCSIGCCSRTCPRGRRAARGRCGRRPGSSGPVKVQVAAAVVAVGHSPPGGSSTSTVSNWRQPIAMRFGAVGSTAIDGSLAASPGMFLPLASTLTCTAEKSVPTGRARPRGGAGREEAMRETRRIIGPLAGATGGARSGVIPSPPPPKAFEPSRAETTPATATAVTTYAFSPGSRRQGSVHLPGLASLDPATPIRCPLRPLRPFVPSPGPLGTGDIRGCPAPPRRTRRADEGRQPEGVHHEVAEADVAAPVDVAGHGCSQS